MQVDKLIGEESLMESSHKRPLENSWWTGKPTAPNEILPFFISFTLILVIWNIKMPQNNFFCVLLIDVFCF